MQVVKRDEDRAIFAGEVESWLIGELVAQLPHFLRINFIYSGDVAENVLV